MPPSKVSRARADGSVELRITGRYADLLAGRLSVEDLDMEELARCQLKDKNGKFTGRPPKYLPADLVQRMKREFFKRGDAIFEESYVDAVNVMRDIAINEKYDEGVRLRAAQYIVERVRGKTPDILVVETEKPWQVAIQRMVVAASELPAAIEDAEVIEEDEPAPRGRRKKA